MFDGDYELRPRRPDAVAAAAVAAVAVGAPR